MKRQRWMPLLIFLLLPLLPLWKTVVYGYSVGPFDQIRQMAPWNGPAPSFPWDVLQADGVLQFFPWRDLVLSAWSKGQVPLWNTFELAGTPLLANSQSAALYPPHVVLGLLHVPTAVAIVALAWFHLSWAGLGCYMLSRSIGASRLGGIVGGATFCLSPFMLSWTALASVITTVSWIPWCFWAISRLFWAVEGSAVARRRTAGALIVSTGMLLLGGHLQFAFYGLLAIGLFSIVGVLSVARQEHSRAWISLGTVFLAVTVGVLLSAAQLLPVMSFGKLSNRQNNPSEQGYADYVKLAIQPFELGALSNPSALGSPREPVSDQNVAVSTYWPPFLKRGANYAESAICVGPFVLGLLGLVQWRDRRTWPLAAVGVFMLLLCLGTPLNRILYFQVPGWSATGSPNRSVVLFVLAACCLGGSAIQSFKGSFKGREWLAPAGLILLGVLLSLYSPALAPAVPETLSKTIEQIQAAAGSQALLTLLISTVLGGAGIALLLATKFARLRRFVVAIPVIFCALCYGTSLVTTGKPLDTVAAPSANVRVAYLNRNWSLYEAARATMPPNTASLSRIHELGGYDSLLSGQTVEMISKIDGGSPAPDVNGNMMLIKSEDDKALSEAGVSFVGTEAGLTPVPNATGRVTLSNGSATIRSEDFSSVLIDAKGSGDLILRDRMMPGWSAEIDGHSVVPKDQLWRAVTISSPGTHVVKFVYSPPGFRTGSILSGLAILITLVSVFGPPLKKP